MGLAANVTTFARARLDLVSEEACAIEAMRVRQAALVTILEQQRLL
jgi:hypothetical protein